MGRRRRKKYKVRTRPKKVLPTIFQCPHCGKKTLTVDFEKENNKAIIKCGSCHIYAEIDVNYMFHPVDAYSKFVDLYHEGAIPLPTTEQVSESPLESEERRGEEE